MQLPPLAFNDISLLLSLGAVILFITAELSSPYYGKTNLTINKTKLRNAFLTTSMLFIIIFAIRVGGLFIR